MFTVIWKKKNENLFKTFYGKKHTLQPFYHFHEIIIFFSFRIAFDLKFIFVTLFEINSCLNFPWLLTYPHTQIIFHIKHSFQFLWHVSHLTNMQNIHALYNNLITSSNLSCGRKMHYYLLRYNYILIADFSNLLFRMFMLWIIFLVCKVGLFSDI